MMQPRLTAALKALIVLMIALLVACQLFLIPGVARQTAIRNPELAYLFAPGVVAAVLFLACVQVVLVCIWCLLSLVRTEKIFSEKAFRYVDIIIAALIAAVVIIIASDVIIEVANAGSPSILLLSLLGVVVGLGLALLMLVLRGLLRKALELEQDLSEVV